MTNKLTTMFCASATMTLLLTAGCTDDNKNPMMPERPNLGSQIDRLGRPGINTAVSNPFFLDQGAHNAIQNAYNNASVPSEWGGLYTASFAGSLAIYDSLDRSCGSQLLAGPTATAGRYDTLASTLANDRLWVNSASGACNVYLAVEANATGVIPNTDCGGRTPLYDVIDVTYSVFAIGAISGVTDGIPRDTDSRASLTAFPFLAPPL